MKIDELTRILMAENEKLFNGISERRVKKIARTVIGAVSTQLVENKEGKISIQGLGTFRKKTIEKEGLANERIIFRHQKKKSKSKK